MDKFYFNSVNNSIHFYLGVLAPMFKRKNYILYFLIIGLFTILSIESYSQSASTNYFTQSGSLGTTYDWIDCSGGTTIVSGDDQRGNVSWPFDFTFYNDAYTTSDNISVATNGFIRLDGNADYSNYWGSNSYDLTTSATNFGQIISMAMSDCYVGRVGTSWVKYLVTGSAPYRVLTIEYNDLSIPYYTSYNLVDVQVSFYESLNKVVLKLGDDNITYSGVDMGIHSGVSGYFNKWQEVKTGSNNSWIEYTPAIKVTASSGTSESYYSSLKSAFDEINSGKHQGSINILIQKSTVENNTAKLLGSGTGYTSYSDVTIYPSTTGLSISGDLYTPLIDLNGADNVTIDGRVNSTGSSVDMVINNTSTSSASGTSTIRFTNDAQNNTIKYCTIKGSETRSTSGVVFFSTSSGQYGNDNNIIELNNITSSSDSNRPMNIIYSAGSSGKENSGNIIRNNNIYNFFKHSSASTGISLYNNTTDWTIANNSFYETTNFSSTGSVTYYVIKVKNTDGNNFIIENNYIGGSSANCGGTAWTKLGTANNLFYGIYLKVSEQTYSSIQNNVIKNVSWTNSGNSDWNAIAIFNGTANIGTETGNVIGATTGTGSITVTGGTNGQDFFGIKISSNDDVNCENNSIGSITASNASNLASRIYGIYKAEGGSTSISDNTIGSTSTASSLQTNSISSSNAQKIYGIYSSGPGENTIHNNTISNLTNYTTNTSTGTQGTVQGIYVNNGINSICDNTIRDLTIANANNSSTTPSAVGILVSLGTGAQDIHANNIYNISNTYNSFSGSVIGMYVKTNSGSATGNVNSNFIHSLSVSSSSTNGEIYGIYENSDEVNYYNNIISVGGNTDSKIIGFYDVGSSGKDINLFFNTISIFGTNSGSQNSFCVKFNTNNSDRDVKNNIFINSRSGASSSHYSTYYDNTGGTLTSDYNCYYVSGTGGVLGYYGGNQVSLPIVSSQDANSLSIDPELSNSTGIDCNDYYASSTLEGTNSTSIIVDYYFVDRVNPPKMGALEAEFYEWQGGTSTDFATASNWTSGAVPPNGADITFAANPDNHCVLDQDRTLKNITNAQGVDKFFVNGNNLTITGELILSNGAQIDAQTTSSVVIFGGDDAQVIPNGAFVSNIVDGLTIDNFDGVQLNGDIIIESALSLTDGQYNLGANSIIINGLISQTSGSLLGSVSTDIIIGGTGAATVLPSVETNNFTLNRPNGISLSDDFHVHGLLTLASGTLDVQQFSIEICGSSPVRTTGDIDLTDTRSEIIFNNSSGIILPTSIFTGDINNITLTGNGGVTCTEDITVNGVMDIQIENPSATKGAWDMHDGPSPKILNLGADATNTGVGEVTGIIRRTSLVAGVVYTYGHPHTTGYFTSDGTIPTEVSAKIIIGTSTAWRSGAINREIEIIQTGGSWTKAMFTCHYLDSELNGNTEHRLSFWTKYMDYEYGRSGQNSDENWVSLSNINVAFFPSSFDDARNLTLDEFSEVTTITWNGSLSDSWTSVENWTPNSGPSAEKNIIIPDNATTPNAPTLPAVTEVKSITIEANGVLNTYSGAQCTINGAGGAWINGGGALNAGNSTVIFTNDSATVSGSTDFYNLTIDTGADLTLNNDGRIGISGTVTNNGIWHTVNGGTTMVDYNGGNQTVVIPNSSTNRYHCLTLSGSGTKILPAESLDIEGNFSVLEGVSVTAAESLDINGNFTIDTGSSFNTSTYNHSISGDIDNNGTFTIGSGIIITMDGSSEQSIMGDSNTVFENLIINNSTGVTLYTDIIINDVLSLTQGPFSIGSTNLTINGTISQTSGYLGAGSYASLTFGGTSNINTVGLFEGDPELYNLTINRTGGIIFATDLKLNGTLDLQSSNPSSTQGTLDMGTNTLEMSDSAVNEGGGDVTGKIKRSNFLPNTEYTFGHPSTTVVFPDIGNLPSEITLKIELGTAPSWKPDAILRVLDIAQIGGSETRATVKSHYLESELNGNAEENISYFGYIFPTTTLLDRGLSEISTAENWISMNNVNLTNIASSFGVIEQGFGVSISDVIEWDGSESTDWYDQYNWTPAIAPNSTKKIIIPDASTTPNDPTLTAGTKDTVKTVAINNGGILNAGAGSQLTIVGTSGVWANYGTFNPSTGKVKFEHGVVSEIATISGETNFYDIEVGANTTFQPVAGNIIRIENIGLADLTSVVDFSTTNNTVEWNGADQTIVNPTGIGEATGYYNLIISGSGTKTMPTSAMNINGDFSTLGTLSLTAADSLLVTGDFTIGSGTTVETGNQIHTVGGNFVNDGTFTATSGSTLIFDGEENQTISGISSSDFYNLTLDNETGVSMLSDVSVSNNINFNNGNIYVQDKALSINGTITQSSGYIETTSASSLVFGGTTELTLNDYLFSSDPSLNNLTINRSGGVNLGLQDITVLGTLTLTSGTLSVEGNKLILSGNSPVRTSGNLDLSQTDSEIKFDNSSAIVLPASLFAGDIYDFTISGTGGVTSGDDITITNKLDLEVANPSSVKGLLDMDNDTLDMGVNATTTGLGDVSGIIRRAHTFTDGIEYSFGNQYTTVNFLGVSGGVKPSWLSCKVELGSAPVWRATNVKRVYKFAQDPAGNDRTYVKLHYLDSELDPSETVKTDITVWNDYDGLVTGDNTFVNGKTYIDTVNNWVELLGMATDFIAPSTGFAKEYGLGHSDVSTITWTGLGSASYPGDWSLPGHWSGGVPCSEDDVLIPASLPGGSCGYPDDHLLITYHDAEAHTIEIESGATLNAENFDLYINGDTNAWNNQGTFLAGNKTVYFNNGNILDTVEISGSTQFHNLNIAYKTNIKPQTGNSILISGNLVCDGIIYDDFDNTIQFNGSAASQQISGIGDIALYNLIMNNTFASGELTLGLPLTVSNLLTLTSNNIICNDTCFISMGAGSSVSPAEGAVNSFVDGKMSKTGTTAFIYPIGTGSVWAPIGVDAPATNSEITAQYYHEMGPNTWSQAFMCSGSGMAYASGVEYWELSTDNEHPAVTLYWKSTVSDIADLPELTVAHYNGSCWENMGGTAVGDATSGSITSTETFTSYSPITFATKSFDNPLPVTLLNFDTYCNGNEILFDWSTASELNNDKFEIQKSYDGERWEKVATIEAYGNSSSQIDYEYKLFNNEKQPVYYKLVQFDFDNTKTDLKISTVDCYENILDEINVKPNPVKDYLYVVSEYELINQEFIIINSLGELVYEGIVNGYETIIDVKEFYPGIYYLKLIGNTQNLKISKF